MNKQTITVDGDIVVTFDGSDFYTEDGEHSSDIDHLISEVNRARHRAAEEARAKEEARAQQKKWEAERLAAVEAKQGKPKVTRANRGPKPVKPILTEIDGKPLWRRSTPYYRTELRNREYRYWPVRIVGVREGDSNWRGRTISSIYVQAQGTRIKGGEWGKTEQLTDRLDHTHIYAATKDEMDEYVDLLLGENRSEADHNDFRKENEVSVYVSLRPMYGSGVPTTTISVGNTTHRTKTYEPPVLKVVTIDTEDGPLQTARLTLTTGEGTTFEASSLRGLAEMVEEYEADLYGLVIVAVEDYSRGFRLLPANVETYKALVEKVDHFSGAVAAWEKAHAITEKSVLDFKDLMDEYKEALEEWTEAGKWK